MITIGRNGRFWLAQMVDWKCYWKLYLGWSNSPHGQSHTRSPSSLLLPLSLIEKPGLDIEVFRCNATNELFTLIDAHQKKWKNASFAISDSEGWLCSVVLQCLKSSANIIQPQRKCASFLDLICFLKSILDLGTLVKIFDISWMLPTLLKLMTKARATWQQPHGPSIMICKPQLIQAHLM